MTRIPRLLVGIRKAQGSDKKLSIALRNVGHAGSNGRGNWFSESSARNLALGMRVAMRRPSSNGMRLSYRQWITRVGVDILGSRSMTSISSNVVRNLTVFSGEEAIRCRSASHRICSDEALGIMPVQSIF